MTDARGLIEHADRATPRVESGYCIDDAARGLVVACREPDPDAMVLLLAGRYLDTVLSAITTDGTCHNQMDCDGNWRDPPTAGDSWGRAIWGLGSAALGAATPNMRARARIGFRHASRQRSSSARAMTFAALGAGALLQSNPHDMTARALLSDAVAAIGPTGTDRAWPLHEGRLRYANGAVAETLILAGDVLNDRPTLDRGLRLLAFVLRLETRDGHLSVTPVGGRRSSDATAGYVQYPIDVAALADACATAYRVTADPRWLAGINLAWHWFTGENDTGSLMFDPATGGGYDHLTARGPNPNQGAQATLAYLLTAQHARDVHCMR